jgi:exopolysaccharide production protein ExoQ
MNPTYVLAACTILVAAFLYSEHKSNAPASWALWLPTVWMLICGSRSVEGWWVEPGQGIALDQLVEDTTAGSAMDRLVLTVLLSLAIVILLRRKVNWADILKNNLWLIVFFLYALTSLLWSDFPFVSFKRWIKAAGPLLMALVIATEQHPLESLERVMRRTAYVLIPFSLVLLKYYPLLGRVYGRWDGQEMWTGVTTHKNSLGQLCAVSVFILFWGSLRRWNAGERHKTWLQPITDVLVVLIAAYLLRGPEGSYSATSVVILTIGSSIAFFFFRVKSFARIVATNLKTFAIAAVLMYYLLAQSLMGLVTSAVNRDETLTGRTDIWLVLREVAATSPIVGQGYGGFWGLHPEITAKTAVGEGHNGYLDIYVELGAVGIALLAVFLLAYCGKVRQRFDTAFAYSVLAVCLLSMTLLYNLSESAFLTNGYLWTTLILMAIVFSSIPAEAADALQGASLSPVPAAAPAQAVGSVRPFNPAPALNPVRRWASIRAGVAAENQPPDRASTPHVQPQNSLQRAARHTRRRN